MPFGTNSFAENPEPRVPCVLILDVSSSMMGQPIQELNNGLIAYKDELSADSLASKRVEVSVITFGSEVKTVCDFTTADYFIPPTLRAEGLTHMGQAVDQAIDALEARKSEYRANGIAYYRPWMFLVSDGAPNDPNWEAAAARAVEAEKAKAFKMFCVGVEGADLQTLGKFSQSDPVKLDGLRFRDMFLWLSSSQQSVSRSTPGDSVPLEDPTSGPNGWASID
ncbi:VWA domain-containing protein [Bremerella cremea]|uniref:VWA domain-containing protein n=1 Tax=Bremerella cremea TaxID=1031537 RepID=A0A368KXU8_9BACT|nr:VWA domain-containing protein [Bremerella cremea]RCS56099.1 VWA domain-containing protein [Bremerella cremea]